MSTIIAGRFQQQEQVQIAIEELQRAGFSPAQISSFYVNPHGQHDTHPLGGDRTMSPGAKESDKGVAKGAAAGAAIGVATSPILGPVGPVTGGLLGAYVGSLAGSLSEMKEKGDKGDENDIENTLPQRKSGMLVAVSVADDDHLDSAINVLRSLGASDIERAEGTIENGDWSDFNPVAPLSLVTAAPGQQHRR